MPDRGPRTASPNTRPWHGGILVNLQRKSLAGGRQPDLRFTIDSFPDDEARPRRAREAGAGPRLSRGEVMADAVRLPWRASCSSPGNTGLARIDYAGNTEILVAGLFGGMIEAEALRLEFTEAHS